MPTLNLDLFPETRAEERAGTNNNQARAGETAALSAGRTQPGTGGTAQRSNARVRGNRSAVRRIDPPSPEISGNPLLDGDEDTPSALNRETPAPEASSPADYGLELPDYNPLLD
jgi:hypothetical protein